MTFHVGQKVVCVDASISTPGEVKTLEEGNIYTVAECCVVEFARVGFECGVLLFEVQRSLPGLPVHFFYSAARFRPVQEKGMSILRAIAANPKRELEVVE